MTHDPEEVLMATVEQTMMKVQRILTGPMNLKVQLQGNMLSVTFTDVSTPVHFRVIDWGVGEDGDPRTIVRVASPILSDVTPSAELYQWIAREGGDYLFGHVVAVDDNDDPAKLFLMMTHTLLGDYLDEAELKTAMWGVLSAADSLDDELQRRFGGKRWVDA
jgi:hypothetical protein